MRPVKLETDLPSRHFAPRIYGVGAWTDHLHFGYDLVALTRPEVLVELGVDRGESFFAFCQAAVEHATGTRCFAVDTWQGDEHAGGYDETTFAEVSRHHRAQYAEFATLIRAPFDQARERFADETIDILHIDGLHTETAVRHDVDNWLPKVRPGGIVVLHDVSVRRPNFGVWKVWEELRARGRSWTFAEGPGLGVWQKPPAHELPPPLETLLTAPNESSDRLAAYYRDCAAQMQEAIASHWRDGTIRDTPFAQQTVIQVFFTRDGTHREEDSVYARIGHDGWKELTIPVSAGGSQGGLRIDFVSALTTIEIATVELSRADDSVFFKADTADAFERLEVRGDAVREEQGDSLRLRITGIDPQIYLPGLTLPEAAGPAELKLKLRVCPAE